MQIRSSEEVKEQIIEFAGRLLRLENEKKKLDLDIRDLKKECKQDGIAVGLVNKAINEMKKAKKQNAQEAFELELIKEALEASKEIDDLIIENVAK